MDATQLDLRMVSILTKYWCRNLNAYPNVCSSEGAFLFKGNSTIPFNPKPKQMKYISLEQMF